LSDFHQLAIFGTLLVKKKEGLEHP